MENKVREIREDIGMNISELARRANTSRNTIYNIEKGITKDVSINLAYAIADALKRNEREIFLKSS
jgi:DNA-binding XRE family transcriptional regulator